MRVFHCTWTLLLLIALPAFAQGASADRQQPAPAAPPGVGYTIFLRGAPIGHQEVRVRSDAQGLLISGQGQIAPPIDVITRRVELKYRPDQTAESLLLEARIGGVDVALNTKFENGTAVSTGMQGNAPIATTDMASAQSFLLPNVFFGSHAVQLTKFSTSTIDADDALNVLDIDSKNGTALYDAVAVATRMLKTEKDRARVLVLLTDGNDASSHSSLNAALAAARKAGILIYPIGIAATGSAQADLQRMAAATGGTYHNAASSSALNGIYASIAAELKRTWQLSYVTSARPGDNVHIRVALDPEGAASANVTVPGTLAAAPPSSNTLPTPFYTPLGGLVLTLIVAFLVLTAAGFAMMGAKGSWIKSRLAPHVEGGPRRKRQERGERLAAFAGLFRVTEQAFGHRKPWKRVHTQLERAAVPLRTVEFMYLMTGSGFLLMVFAGVAGRSSLEMLLALAVGMFLPYGWVAFKARRRMAAFDDATDAFAPGGRPRNGGTGRRDGRIGPRRLHAHQGWPYDRPLSGISCSPEPQARDDRGAVAQQHEPASRIRRSGRHRAGQRAGPQAYRSSLVLPADHGLHPRVTLSRGRPPGLEAGIGSCGRRSKERTCGHDVSQRAARRTRVQRYLPPVQR